MLHVFGFGLVFFGVEGWREKWLEGGIGLFMSCVV